MSIHLMETRTVRAVLSSVSSSESFAQKKSKLETNISLKNRFKLYWNIVWCLKVIETNVELLTIDLK